MELQSSNYLKDILFAKETWIHYETKADQLTKKEIQLLIANGNQAENWTWIRVLKGEKLNPKRIQNCSFSGRILLGSFDTNIDIETTALPSGLYHSTIHNCVISPNVLIMKTTLISQSFLHSHAIVLGCGLITSNKNTAFANGLEIPVGIETGGREILCFAEMPFSVAANVGKNRINCKKEYANQVQSYVTKATANMNIICSFAKLINCPAISSVYVGEYACLNTAQVSNVSILSSKSEPTNIDGQSFVRNSIIQWGCHVDTMAIVQDSFLCDHSHVSLHGKVLSSLLGPNTGISEGECTSSFVGPFVGFHHQSLLIASFWPEGKGNIGYGANVGSNHTLKAPDQEIWPGEGVFFGLGVNIKFPSNFTNAPYSVIATGVMTLPQKVDMPFSLINGSSISTRELSPAINEITPGWVLSSSVFTVLRNEHKFKTRNRSTRSKIEYRIFRPDIIDMMKHAREQLVKAQGKHLFIFNEMPIFTDRQVSGLGKNYMTERSRVAGIQAYTFFIRHYVYTHLVELLEQNSKALEDTHVRNTLKEEFGATSDIKQLLQQAVVSFHQIAERAEKGKSRDDKRGARIIPDYTTVHKAASEEKIVILAKERAQAVERLVDINGKLLSRL